MVEQRIRDLVTSTGITYSFRQVTLRFETPASGDAFARKNNKSLGQTLLDRRYRTLAPEAAIFAEAMQVPLGEFLLVLKRSGNPFYKRFLNNHGDLPYSIFKIDDPVVLRSKGVYAYYVSDDLRYIGRCKDTMRRRINQGYGKIYPKNCYLDGQRTNCRLNAMITEMRKDLSLWFCPLDKGSEITAVEADLIRRYRPPWNARGW